MKKMVIFEPAMCCSTGVCGPSVDQELLRVSTVLNNFKNRGVMIERYNLSNNPQIFVMNPTVHQLLSQEGTKVLPLIMVDGQIMKTGGYPSNEEFCSLLGLPINYLQTPTFKMRSNDCGCKDGCC
jgi:Arsenical resistance operon protein ArsD